MKRKIFLVVSALVITVLTTILSTACIGSWIKTKPLKDYDFSVDNIVEVRMSSSPMFISLHGTIYGVRKGDSLEGDALIAEIAEQWTNLQQNAIFRMAKKHNVAIRTGGTFYYECIFSDGSSVKLSKDVMTNLYVGDSKSMRIDEEYMFDNFNDTFKKVMQQDYIVGHISQNHNDSCDCDMSSIC